jgi:hypothetical protein
VYQFTAQVAAVAALNAAMGEEKTTGGAVFSFPLAGT